MATKLCAAVGPPFPLRPTCHGRRGAQKVREEGYRFDGFIMLAQSKAAGHVRLRGAQTGRRKVMPTWDGSVCSARSRAPHATSTHLPLLFPVSPASQPSTGQNACGTDTARTPLEGRRPPEPGVGTATTRRRSWVSAAITADSASTWHRQRLLYGGQNRRLDDCLN